MITERQGLGVGGWTGEAHRPTERWPRGQEETCRAGAKGELGDEGGATVSAEFPQSKGRAHRPR